MTVFDALLAAAAVPAVGFTVHYLWATRKVRRLPESWHIVTFTACLALVFVTLLLPRFPGKRGLLIVLVAGVAAALWWRWWLLWRVVHPAPEPHLRRRASSPSPDLGG